MPCTAFSASLGSERKRTDSGRMTRCPEVKPFGIAGALNSASRLGQASLPSAERVTSSMFTSPMNSETNLLIGRL